MYLFNPNIAARVQHVTSGLCSTARTASRSPELCNTQKCSFISLASTPLFNGVLGDEVLGDEVPGDGVSRLTIWQK